MATLYTSFRLDRTEAKDHLSLLANSAGHRDGVYIIARSREPGAVSPKELPRLLVEDLIVYVGCSTNLPARAQSAIRAAHDVGVPGYQHGFGRSFRQLQAEGLTLDDLAMLAISFAPGFALEDFLLKESVRMTGRYPIGNHGPSTMPSTTIRRRPVKLTWSDLLVCPL
ncbi:MAG: hypothetical protein Q8L66_13855 [Caulobacter sp.]|nr:hypothetical protein [Caulobacter sp.]